jgi:hypothetical protein
MCESLKDKKISKATNSRINIRGFRVVTTIMLNTVQKGHLLKDTAI